MFRNTVMRTIDKSNHVTLYIPCRTKTQLPIQWERPLKIPNYAPERSGDLKTLKEYDFKKMFPLLFDKSEELQTANEDVKRLFSLEFQKRDKLVQVIRRDYMNSVGRHIMDTSSPEAIIAALTGSIRHLQKYMDSLQGEKAPRVIRVYLKEIVEKRALMLRILRLKDYKKFEWLLEELQIIYKPPPTPFPIKVFRKESLRKLTDSYCEKVRQEKLDQYKNHLQSQQEDFLKNKLESLKWIQSKEKECNISASVTDEDIENVSKQLEELKLLRKNNTEVVVE